MAADIIMKRHDTFPPLKVELLQVNQASGTTESLNLESASKVRFLMKKLSAEGKPEGATIPSAGLECKSWGGAALNSTEGKKGRVEVVWTKEITENLGKYCFEFEIEFPEVAGVKKFQTCPSEGYRTIEFVEDLEAA